MKKLTTLFLIAFSCLLLPVAVSAASFGDVPNNAYYAQAVTWAVSKGVTDGFSDGTFRPDATCTRGQVVTFLWRANGKPEPQKTANPFSDVDAASPFYKAILWACEKEITNGTSPTTFNPSGTCTRGQIVTFIWRANGKPSASGSSSLTANYPPNAYYKDAVTWADNLGLLGGTGKAFKPEDACPRADVVTYLYRNDKPNADVQTLFNQGLTAFHAGDYDNAVFYWEQAAAQGHLQTLNNLATLYLDESKGHVDYTKGRLYFEQLANTGDGYALYQLGHIYLNARGVPRNPEKAKEYLEQAATSDHSAATSDNDGVASWALGTLGQMYEQGIGVPQDYEKALECYQKANEKVYSEANAAKVAELQAKLNG